MGSCRAVTPECRITSNDVDWYVVHLQQIGGHHVPQQMVLDRDRLPLCGSERHPVQHCCTPAEVEEQLKEARGRIGVLLEVAGGTCNLTLQLRRQAKYRHQARI